MLQQGHILNEEETIEEWESKVRGMDLTSVKYLVFQQEVGEQQGGHHIQGFISFEGPKRPTTIARMFGLKPETFQTVNGTPKQNRDYCSKEATRKPGCTTFEHGTIPDGQGARSDLKRAADLIS